MLVPVLLHLQSVVIAQQATNVTVMFARQMLACYVQQILIVLGAFMDLIVIL